jgi:predicted transcriptional regulator
MEEPVIRASINRTVVVGPDLGNRLEAIARVRGGDASWLARAVLSRYVDTVERAARVGPDDE